MTISCDSRGICGEGQQTIAEEHRLLAEKIDRASSLIVELFSKPTSRTPAGIHQILDVMDDLIKNAQEHFQHEEALMTKNEFPGLVIHKRDHDYLIKSLKDYTSSLGHGVVPVSADFGVNLQSWLSYHIKKFDEAYVAFSDARKGGAERT